ncbi:MAG: adenylate/guanylate cyclase domain-containing protein, partial [Gemmatimonadota bacterium]
YVSIVEGREKRFIKGAFGKYLSPDVVAEIANDPDSLALGGQSRPLTLLFSDLSGFTSLSERLDPEALVALLNEYLDDMTRVVLEERGYLDKYIGDAIMAFWNAPRDVPDHAARALRSAVLMQRALDDLNTRWGASGGERPELRARIGVHTGEAVVGNVGGRDRFDYSAIGDAVNLAARIEPANDTYGTRIMTSRETLDAAGPEAFRSRELDLVTVKGKDTPVAVYEVVELADATLPAGLEEALERYRNGLVAYRERSWAKAKALFLSALEAWPDDGPSRVYVARCDEHLADPPGADWDFVVRRTSK